MAFSILEVAAKVKRHGSDFAIKVSDRKGSTLGLHKKGLYLLFSSVPPAILLDKIEKPTALETHKRGTLNALFTKIMS